MEIKSPATSYPVRRASASNGSVLKRASSRTKTFPITALDGTAHQSLSFLSSSWGIMSWSTSLFKSVLSFLRLKRASRKASLRRPSSSESREPTESSSGSAHAPPGSRSSTHSLTILYLSPLSRLSRYCHRLGSPLMATRSASRLCLNRRKSSLRQPSQTNRRPSSRLYPPPIKDWFQTLSIQSKWLRRAPRTLKMKHLA